MHISNAGWNKLIFCAKKLKKEEKQEFYAKFNKKLVLSLHQNAGWGFVYVMDKPGVGINQRLDTFESYF